MVRGFYPDPTERRMIAVLTGPQADDERASALLTELGYTIADATAAHAFLAITRGFAATAGWGVYTRQAEATQGIGSLGNRCYELEAHGFALVVPTLAELVELNQAMRGQVWRPHRAFVQCNLYGDESFIWLGQVEIPQADHVFV